MPQNQEARIARIMSLPILQAEWVLIIAERSFFLLRHLTDLERIEARLSQVLTSGAREEVIAWLNTQDSLEANVLARELSEPKTAQHDAPAHERRASRVRGAISRSARAWSTRSWSRSGPHPTIPPCGRSCMGSRKT